MRCRRCYRSHQRRRCSCRCPSQFATLVGFGLLDLGGKAKAGASELSDGHTERENGQSERKMGLRKRKKRERKKRKHAGRLRVMATICASASTPAGSDVQNGGNDCGGIAQEALLNETLLLMKQESCSCRRAIMICGQRHNVPFAVAHKVLYEAQRKKALCLPPHSATMEELLQKLEIGAVQGAAVQALAESCVNGIDLKPQTLRRAYYAATKGTHQFNSKKLLDPTTRHCARCSVPLSGCPQLSRQCI